MWQRMLYREELQRIKSEEGGQKAGSCGPDSIFGAGIQQQLEPQL